MINISELIQLSEAAGAVSKKKTHDSLESHIIDQLSKLVPDASSFNVRVNIDDKASSIEFTATIDGKKYQCFDMIDQGMLKEKSFDSAVKSLVKHIRSSSEYQSGKVNKFSFNSSINETVDFSECPEEYKNLSMSESSLYFENQMLRCELEYRDMMDESVNEMIQDMIDRKNGIINESSVDIKSKLKKIKDFIVKVFTTIFNAIKNFIIKVKEALNLIGKKMDVSALDNADLMKPKVFMLDSDDTTYRFDVKLKPFNITDPKCAKKIEDEINLTFNLLYNLIENVILDKQVLARNTSKELFTSIDDIINKYCINVIKVFDDCTRDGQYKKHSKYNQAANGNYDYTAKSNPIKDKFGESENSVEITFKLSDYIKVDDRKSDGMFSELVKKSTGVDYSALLSGVNDYLKTMEDLAKQSSKDREKLEKLVEKITFYDDQKDTSESDMEIRLMTKIIEATRTMYESIISICMSNINTFIANKASFIKAFIAAKHDYIMWSSNNKKKNSFTNKNEEEDAKSRKKNSDDFDVEMD